MQATGAYRLWAARGIGGELHALERDLTIRRYSAEREGVPDFVSGPILLLIDLYPRCPFCHALIPEEVRSRLIASGVNAGRNPAYVGTVVPAIHVCKPCSEKTSRDDVARELGFVSPVA